MNNPLKVVLIFLFFFVPIIGLIVAVRDTFGYSKEALRGYPAHEGGLKNKQLYWVSAAMIDQYPAHVDYLAVLREVDETYRSERRISGTNRFFTLSTNLSPKGFYRFHRDGTNTWFLGQPLER